MAQGTIRMMALPNGLGLEPFECRGPDEHGPAVPAGWQYGGWYVDDLEQPSRFEAVGGHRRDGPPGA